MARTMHASRPPPAARLRPGERPAWWYANVDHDQFPAWRTIAAQQRLAVDVLVALLVEFDFVLTDLRDTRTDPDALLASALAHPVGLRRLGPAGPLRGWLAGASPFDANDELPELVLPERLVARLVPGRSLACRLCLDRVAVAIACDRRAAEHGRTLESWALSAALHHDSPQILDARSESSPFALRPH